MAKLQCSDCQYFRDFGWANLGLRCLNKKNASGKQDFFAVPSPTHSCGYFSAIVPLEQSFEWDPNKNLKNIDKHGLKFEHAFNVLLDPSHLQMVSPTESWEDTSDEYLESIGVEKNEGNSDPVRGTITGQIGDKLFTFAYTFRHEIGLLKYRVFSFRRASEEEERAYYSLSGKRRTP